MDPITSTVTSTAGSGLSAIPDILAAFSASGVLAGLAALFAALGGFLHLGGLGAKLSASKFDWVPPLVMLIGAAGAAGFGSAAAGAAWYVAVGAGLAAGIGSGFLSRVIKEAQD